MFQRREQRQKVKNILMVSSIVLAAVLVILCIYGIIAVRPQHIDKASKLGQYYEFNSTSLPSASNGLQQELGLKRSVFVGDRVTDNEVIGDIKDPTELEHHSKPRIAILVTNLGLNPLSTELALSLPKEVSLGFLPYTTSLKSMLHKAHENGHEIFMYLPFETKKYPDDSPGQMPLLLSLGDVDNIQRMHNILHAFDGYIGVYGAPNEIFTHNSDKVAAILAEVASKKLKLFVSSNSSFTGEMANLVISSTVIIDAEPNIPAIKKQLDTLVELAKSGKIAIGYAGSYPVTIYTLKAWLPTLKEMGIEVMPVTSITSKEVK
jgi:polysaccharide deacetylase 2 family uncharacterized protein YibQ